MAVTKKKTRRTKLTEVQLIRAVQRVTKDTSAKEVEGLLLQVCTRIRKDTPFPKNQDPSYYDSKSGHGFWDRVILELFRNS